MWSNLVYTEWAKSWVGLSLQTSWPGNKSNIFKPKDQGCSAKTVQSRWCVYYVHRTESITHGGSFDELVLLREPQYNTIITTQLIMNNWGWEREEWKKKKVCISLPPQLITSSIQCQGSTVGLNHMKGEIGLL